MQNLEQLQRKIEENFNLDELEDLAFSVDAKWDDIPGKRLKDKARELILLMQRRKGLPRLIEALQTERPQTNWLEGTNKDTPCPYRGLHAFREEDEHLFFGRSTLTDRLLTTAKVQNFVAVLGPSGSGKSSVVMAGLLPRLRQENRWLVATFRPGAQPFRALAMTLLPLLYPHHGKLDLMEEEEKLVARLRHKPGSLQQVIAWILREQEPGTKLLFVADQFEELYTLCQDRELRHAFLDQLLVANAAANAASQPIHLLLLTLRSDFLGQFQNDHAPFVEALQTGTVFMQLMDQDGLQQAIKYPALNVGVAFDDTLVERILEDVAQQPGQLPLLEFALSLLWERRENGIVSHAAYEAIGRVKGALAQYADKIYAQLTEAEQEQGRFIFLKLVQPGEGTEDTRRVARKAEIGEGRWPLVSRLADTRLIVTGQNEAGEETVEVIHEALIWGWQQLQDWVNHDRKFLTWHKQLHRAHQQWQESRQNEGDLLRGTLLQQAAVWFDKKSEVLADSEIQFIQISVKMNERDQRDLLIAKINRGEAKGKDFEKVSLVDAELVAADLMGINLNKADLTGADLTLSDLSGAYLNEAVLVKAKLEDARLVEAVLTGANLYEAKLKRSDLGGADLAGADLSKADLREVNINDVTIIDNKWRNIWEIVNYGAQQKNLREVDLSRAALIDTDLKGSDLRGANLKEAILNMVDLREADLTGANLEGAKLLEVDLQDAILTDVNLCGATLSGLDMSEFNLTRVDLRGTNISKSNLMGAIMIKVDLCEAALSDLDMVGANLHGANLNGVVFTQVDLSDANLSNADLRGADLRGAKLSRSKLTGAKLSGADFRSADLSETELKGVELRGAILREADLHDTILIGLDLSGFDLSGANLRGANLARANLRGAFLWTTDLMGANLNEANLREADLRVSDLRGVKLKGTDLRGADLRFAFLIADLNNAKYDAATKWPERSHPHEVKTLS